MLSKKHFRAIANAIALSTTSTDPSKVNKEVLVMYLIDLFSQENERFDADKFRMACSETEEI